MTGRNLRSILALTDKSAINQLHCDDMELVSYYDEPEQVRIESICEVLEMRAAELELPDGWQMQQILRLLYSTGRLLDPPALALGRYFPAGGSRLSR